MQGSSNTSSTPQHHCDKLQCQEQDSRVMHTPQHWRLPAQPSNDDLFVADASVTGGT